MWSRILQVTVTLFTVLCSMGLRMGPRQMVHMSSSIPSAPRDRALRGLIQGGAVVVSGLVVAHASSGKYPVTGDERIMADKAHGTSAMPVQSALRYGVDLSLADRICNYNRRWAENAGYWQSTKLFKLVRSVDPSSKTPISYYDSVTGKELFRAPVDRTMKDWIDESISHGWPSFRDSEVVWDNVRCLKDGETVSLTGTHLGHNLPDRKGNRYCINIVSIAGNPV